MAKSKKRRKILVFSLIGLAVAGLTAFALLRKREPVITVQAEKVVRRNLTELVTANGRIQPVLQVKISPEVSGEIVDLPVKEGDCLSKGDLILKIKPDFYIAQRNQSEASYKSSLASQETAEATLRKVEAEYRRQEDLYKTKLISDSAFDEAKAARDVAKAQLSSAEHQVEMAKALLARSDEELAKTTMVSPLAGTVSKLDSRLGERVVGTATMAGTEVMTIADLNEMEARVDIGEMDVVLIKPGQTVRLEVDAFKDRKFKGVVSEIANSSRTAAAYSSGSSQEATKFEVKIRIKEKEQFRPGMSVTAEIETRSRTNVLTVPIASVTARVPKEKDGKAAKKLAADAKGAAQKTNSASPKTASASADTNNPPAATGDTSVATAPAPAGTNDAKADKKAAKPVEVVFLVADDHVKMVPVKIGISDDAYWEITEGLQESQEVVSGGFRAITRDLEDGKKIRKGQPIGDKEKEEGTKENP
jgi:HlyD family secretion protein